MCNTFLSLSYWMVTKVEDLFTADVIPFNSVTAFLASQFHSWSPVRLVQYLCQICNFFLKKYSCPMWCCSCWAIRTLDQIIVTLTIFLACLPGHRWDYSSGRRCVPCPIGTYATSQWRCTSCPAGTTTTGEAETSAAACRKLIILLILQSFESHAPLLS